MTGRVPMPPHAWAGSGRPRFMTGTPSPGAPSKHSFRLHNIVDQSHAARLIKTEEDDDRPARMEADEFALTARETTRGGHGVDANGCECADAGTRRASGHECAGVATHPIVYA